MASSPAVYHEIVSSGLQDQALVAATLEDAVITFWRFIHMKHTSFALEPIEFQQQSGNVAFGAQSVKFTVPRNADLCYHMFAKVKLPGIVGLTVDGSTHTVVTGDTAEPYYVNAIGQYVLSKVKLTIGNSQIDELENTYLYMWEELSGKPGKRLSEMIGKFDTVELRQSQSRRSRTLYVPLPFYFTENTGLALPIVSLQFHQVQIEIDFARRDDCIVKPANFPSNGDIYVRTDGQTNAEIEAGSLPRKLADTDLQCSIEMYGVFTDFDERSKFAHGQFEQIISQVQHQHSQVSHTTTTANEDTAAVTHAKRLNLNNAVVQYIWAVRRKANEDAHDWFNFGGHDDPVSEVLLDPVRSATIKFNNNDRVRKRLGLFWRLVVPYVAHTNIPRGYIYTWSFAIEPEDAQTTGYANLSRIDNPELYVELDPRIFLNSSNTATILFHARSKNTLRFRFGLCTLKFGP